MIWRTLILAGTVWFAFAQRLNAQGVPQTGPDYPTIRKAIAFVVTRGIDTTRGNIGIERQGTGFFINPEGYLVTAYHVADLGSGVQEASISYEVTLDGADKSLPAISIYGEPHVDLRVLYVDLDDREIATLKAATRAQAGLKQGSTVYTAGYPGGYHFSVGHGDIRAFNGPLRPVLPAWSVNIDFVDGQSGSPILSGSGSVVALAVKSDDDHPGVGFVTPITLVPSQYFNGKFVYTDDAPTVVLSQTSGNQSTLLSETRVSEDVNVPLPAGINTFDNLRVQVRDAAGRPASGAPVDAKKLGNAALKANDIANQVSRIFH